MTDLSVGGTINLKIGKKKVLKVIFNVEMLTNQLWRAGFGICSLDKSGAGFGIKVSGSEGKRQYDGSYTFTFDASNSDINEIILVWGSTRMPQIPGIVQKALGKAPKATVNPDEAVSQWAAIQWGIIQWDVTDILLLDVTPLSLAVEVEWGLAHVMIPKNTTIPAKKSNIYTTAADNQTAVTVHVTQWERQFARDNKSLWMFNLEWIPPMRRWMPQIEVTFDIDANWILNVTAQEKSTWKQQSVTIAWSTNISDEEIEKAKAEAEKFAEEDRKRKEVIEAKNWLESMVYAIEWLGQEYKEKISDEDKEIINKLVADGKAMKDKEDVTAQEVKDETDRLQRESQPLFQKYAQTAQQNADANGWAAPAGESGPVEWEVVNA